MPRRAVAGDGTHLPGQHLITTPVKVARCRRCRVTVLVALVAGIPTMVDPTPVDEAAALREGRWTYRLDRGRLVLREDWGSGLPPASPILADHRHTNV